MPEDFGPTLNPNSEKLGLVENENPDAALRPASSGLEQNLAVAEATGITEQIRTITKLEPDLVAAEPEIALLANMTPEDVQAWPGDKVELALTARNALNALSLSWPELATYAPPVSLIPPPGKLTSDYLHVTGLTIPWRAKSEFVDALTGKPVTERAGIVEDRDYTASVFLIIDQRKLHKKAIDDTDDGSLIELPSRTLVKRIDAGTVKLYSKGNDFRPVLDQKGFFVPNPPGAPVFSERYKVFPAEVAKGSFHKFTHFVGFDPLKPGAQTPEDAKRAAAERSQIVNDDERKNFVRATLLEGAYLQNELENEDSNLVYYLRDAFVVLEPAKKTSDEQPFVERVIVSAIESKAKALIDNGIDAAALNVGGPLGLALSLFGKAFFSELQKDLKAKGAGIDEIITVPLTKRALGKQSAPAGETIIPVDNVTVDSTFESPIGTKPELWVYGALRTKPFEQLEQPTIEQVLKQGLVTPIPLGNPLLKGLGLKSMKTKFDLLPSVRLKVRRITNSAAEGEGK